MKMGYWKSITLFNLIFWKLGQCYRKNQIPIVKGVRWICDFGMNKAVRIGTNQGTLLVWILNSCCFDYDDVIWDSSKG
jgi:hypothetical protein